MTRSRLYYLNYSNEALTDMVIHKDKEIRRLQREIESERELSAELRNLPLSVLIDAKMQLIPLLARHKKTHIVNIRMVDYLGNGKPVVSDEPSDE